jgi:uroporphyrinogen decarboxylase
MLDDIVSLGMNGLNPLEPGCMDIKRIQESYPDLTLIGNVDVNLLANGTPDQIKKFVQNMFKVMNKNNRFIPASGNSIPSFAKPENVRAMIEEIHNNS